MTTIANALRAALAAFTMLLLLVLAGVVISATVSRYVLNASFIWYDEVAGVLLAWITFYGAAYAAARRRHLGFEGLVLATPMPFRLILFVIAELVTHAVFVILAYAGWVILGIFGTETLVSLRWVPLWFTQSVVPVGAGVFILAQLVSTHEAYARIRSGRSAEAEEIDEEIANARRAEAQRTGAVPPRGEPAR